MAYVLEPPPTPTLAVQGDEKTFPVRRIYCVGRNYWEHAIEMGAEPEKEPPFFFHKPSDAAVDCSRSSLEAPMDLPYPPKTENLHFEGELVIAIGQTGKDLTPEAAGALIWGYGVGVDLTRRDLQNEAKQMKRPWCTSKGFDYSGPVGALVPAQNFDISGKNIELKVNGERKQFSELSKMIWNCNEIVAHISSFHTMQPGDIIFTGTPAGVGALKPGDVCEVLVEGLPSCVFKMAK